MELSSKYVGTKIKSLEKEITWRETTNYAAAVGDNNPAYLDDERKGGIVAPPMLAEAITWRISGRIWEFIEGDFPSEVLMTQVHYTEHVSFHRPVRPGDKLTVGGKIAAIMPHRAGTHVVIRYDATDKKDEPVFTMHTGAMLRGVKCTDEGAGGDSLPVVPEPQQDGPGWESKIFIDPLAPYVYDGCTDIVFPIHTSPRFAKGVGLPGIILQGTATLAFSAREILNREADADPARLAAIACRFTGMVLPGSEITVRVDGTADRDGAKDVFFSVLNGEGEKALSGGYAKIRE